MSPNAEGGGGGYGVSANKYSCALRAQINFGDLTPYLTMPSGHVQCTSVHFLHIALKNFGAVYVYHFSKPFSSNWSFIKSISKLCLTKALCLTLSIDLFLELLMAFKLKKVLKSSWNCLLYFSLKLKHKWIFSKYDKCSYVVGSF